jgi:THAP domain
MSQLNTSAPNTGSIQNTNILPQHKIMLSSVQTKKIETCLVRYCMSGKRKNGDTSGISFHVFPTSDQPQRRQKWLQLLNITKSPSKEALVCSRHFDKSDFFLINSVQKGLFDTHLFI